MSSTNLSDRGFSPSLSSDPRFVRPAEPRTRVVYLTMGLLPQKKQRWSIFLFSYTVCAVIVVLMVFAHLLWPDRIDSRLAYRVIDIVMRPNAEPPPPPPKPKPAAVKPQPQAIETPPPVTIEKPKLVVPKDLPRAKPQVTKVEPPKIQPTIEPPKLQPLATTIPRTIHTGSFGSSATPTVKAPPEKVQTGGFGDPTGLPGVGKQGARLTVSGLGSFDLPPGPGKGNGTGGAKGIPGTVASAGFGNGIAQPAQGGSKNGQGVQTGGFAAQQVATNTGKHVAEDSGPATVPVEILYKPKPVYTEEARKLNLEGEVVLEVMFHANGELQVNRVVRGLGHGLDEAAVNAAGKIKFKPAQRNGSAVDSTAVVHVLFQLAS